MDDEYSSLMSPQMRGSHSEMDVQLQRKGNNQAVPKIEKPAYHDMVIEAHRQMMQQLCTELLGYIYVQHHQFFETMVIDVLLALGYVGGGVICREDWAAAAMVAWTASFTWTS